MDGQHDKMSRNIMGKYFIVFLCILLTQFSCKQNSEKNVSGNAESSASSQDTVKYSLENLNSKLQLDPKNPNLLHSRALVYIQLKNFGEALKDIQFAIKIDSSQSKYYQVLADIYFAGKKSLLAKTALEKALQIDPQNKEANLKLAELYLLVKKHKLSIQYLDQVLQQDKFNPKAYFMKGMNFKEAGDTAKAISSFQTATEQDPSYYDAFMQLGILFSLKNNALSVQYYTTALSLHSNSEEAYYGRAMFLQEHGQAQKAIEDYKYIQTINPMNKYAHYNQGYIYLVYLEKFDVAVGYFGNAIQIDPSYTAAYFNRGLAYEMMGNKSNAKADYQKALQTAPNYTAAKERLKGLQ